MRVAAAQIACSPGNVPENVAKIREFATRARDAGADLVVFPEMSDTGYTLEAIQNQSSSWSDGAVPQLQKMARDLGLVIVCGVSEREGGQTYNTQVVVDPQGNLAAKYRKTHLFVGGKLSEDKCFSPGTEFTDFDLGEFRFGLTICYDLRFPEIYRALAVNKGVNAFLISAAWPIPRIEHLRALVLARAIENQSYVILSNRVGSDDGVTTCGSSVVIDPYGVIVAAASADREELVVADLFLDVVTQVRSRIQVFADRRADLYR